jgi:HD-GYP domain-containing protein (c-di-GMP phosphodiesterase class II)
VIDDAYNLPAGAEYEINRTFDEKNGYLTRSLLVFPMTNHAGDVIGVLQLINRRRSGANARLTAATVPEHVVPFDEATADIMRALASQAAVAVENNLLYESIERLFEGFVTAAVTAIEQRDPTTSGHSFRVADLTVELARVIDRIDSGPYRDVRFSGDQVREIRYASLLHDFGKVGVREQVLVKEKKLYPHDLELIRHRFAYLTQRADLEFERARADFVLARGNQGYDAMISILENQRGQRRRELQCWLEAIVRANEPTVMPEGSFDALHQIRDKTFVDFEGRVRPLLENHELQFLMIRKGNLDDDERREIESHVTHTYRFLEQIPWTRELRNIPQIAYGHHEKLNGAGYPNALGGAAIPVQTRMMTIADIYDALTATDRPYKRAVPSERALDILRLEAKDGMLDATLLDAFVQARVFEQVPPGTAGD